jgi:DNA invertase Pin-like site-specific DNA recombinase
MNPKLTDDHLKRRAIVYVRQSSLGQVHHNHESQRRQYGLQDRARELGFSDVVVIDEDLGRSGSGLVERPGFQRLVAAVLGGEVGAVFSIEASRLARNGRDWHHLIELCGMAGTLVVDTEGIYDPRLLNDRLLLGLKGTMSEFELGLLRQRSHEAARQKARRGELRFLAPIGYCWPREGKLEMDPDQRVQHALHLAFAKLTELGTVRQVLLWFRSEGIEMPTRVAGGEVVWRLPVYESVLKLFKNPMYAGAYAFGRTQSKTSVVNGRSRKTEGHRRSAAEWHVLIRDHHPGYISWEQYERNQAMISSNSYMKSRTAPHTGRGGPALLTGLLRCKHCGWILHVSYDARHGSTAYRCMAESSRTGQNSCPSVSGRPLDTEVGNEILRVIGGNAVQAAVQAIEQMREQQQQHRHALELELEQARYDAHLAARRYEAVDPANRLVASELERRWNTSMDRVSALERRLECEVSDMAPEVIPDKELLLSLAQDLPAVWNSPAADMRLKQRIVQILIREIIVDVDQEKREILLVIHWMGGRHSELRIKKRKRGDNGRGTSIEALDIIRQMTGRFSDEQIATTLNRMGMKTGAGKAWTQQRIAAFRYSHQLRPADPAGTHSRALTMEQAADRLGISTTAVRHMIERKLIPATQVVSCAPWEIAPEALDSKAVQAAVEAVKRGRGVPRDRNTIEDGSLSLEFGSADD